MGHSGWSDSGRSIRRDGRAGRPEDGPVAWTSHADLAEAAAIALSDDGLEGVTPALTGSEAIDLEGIAGIASEVADRPIRRVVVSDADYREGLVGNGVPETAADMLTGLFLASRRGEFAQVDQTLARLIGRPPTTLRDVLDTAATRQPTATQ